ncbi:hypothetical protein C1645_839843 [Glomus cerebriforme]|uniref:Uncharacterized protein n=1 Tax=Glomus cerebriforme TaxID=658196 RepID=A0A397S661_9GLOM|nr:hypothetical protein C1645_839843 [Glomus cerebriforme]
MTFSRFKKQLYIDPTLPGAIGTSLSKYKKHVSCNFLSLELLKHLANYSQSPDYFLGYDHESLDTKLDLSSYNKQLNTLYLKSSNPPPHQYAKFERDLLYNQPPVDPYSISGIDYIDINVYDYVSDSEIVFALSSNDIPITAASSNNTVLKKMKKKKKKKKNQSTINYNKPTPPFVLADDFVILTPPSSSIYLKEDLDHDIALILEQYKCPN